MYACFLPLLLYTLMILSFAYKWPCWCEQKPRQSINFYVFHLAPCYRCFFLGDFLTLVLAAITEPFQFVIPGIVFAVHDVLISCHSDTDTVVPFRATLHHTPGLHQSRWRFPYKLHIDSSQMPQQPFRICKKCLKIGKSKLTTRLAFNNKFLT